ncbi:Glutamate 5-kinase at N-terminal half [Coccomyxa sp. Obi]|nr:Glutamate 5-kinase at N-terminal half [Coccomyxa sp. Obi]
MKERSRSSALTIVIKVGTSSLVRPQQNTLNLSNLARLCEVVRDLNADGHKVVIVSSGAVGVGAQRLGLGARPKDLSQKQALAAVGQVHLMRFYDDFFSALGLTCAQVLLSLGNLANRGQYLNASNTFTELFNYGTVPVVNENDTVAVEELRIGDNDTLSAQVATLVRADWLFLLTDVPSLFTANPSTDPTAEPIHEVHDIAALQVDTSVPGTQWGTGGMATKLTAARLATAAGCHMVICQGSQPEQISAILRGERAGTVFYPHLQALKGRKRWILSVPVKGTLLMDTGAVRAVIERSKSLFSAGIVGVSGDFNAQDAVQLCDANGTELGRGLCNYSAAEVDRIKGKSSKDFVTELGYLGEEEIVHRDNICLLSQRRYQANFSEANLDEHEDAQEQVEEERGSRGADGLHKHFTEHVSIEPSVGIAAASDGASTPSNSEIFRQDSEQGEASSHFSFVPRPLPLHGRPGSDDLSARLAILREHRAEAVSGSQWSGESASVPSRVHVLPRIDDDVVFSTGSSKVGLGSWQGQSTLGGEGDVLQRLKELQELEAAKAAGPDDAEFQDWKVQLHKASSAERVAEPAGVNIPLGNRRVSSSSSGSLGVTISLWKPSLEQAIPNRARGRQHGSSNALNLMHSLSPASCDVSDGGWLPR